MKHFYNNLKGIVIGVFCFLSFMTNAQLNVNSSATATDLANAILGSGVTVSNVSLHCGNGGSGIFSNGGTTNVGLNDGIILTSGLASQAIGPNNSGNTTFNQGNAFNGDAQLSTIVAGDIEDACVLEFDFVAESDFISVQYAFGSEEYNEYVCSVFNDVFGFFVTGANPAGGNYNNVNVALVPSTTLPVSVNTINNGSSGANGNNANCVSLTHSNLYNDNAGGLTIQYDGLTVVLTTEVAVVPGETYHFKFAIADVSDSQLDSGVFIRSQSFSVFSCAAGILNFAPGSAQQFCYGDNAADILNVVTTSSASNDTYAFLLTDVDGNILEMNATGSFDLAAYAVGNYLVYGVSYDGIVSGIEVGQNVSDINAAEDEGCFDLSAPLPVRLDLCTTFELVACAPDVTVECGSDLENFEVTGYPQIVLLNADGDVTFTHFDTYLSMGDCGAVISRLWTITYGNTTLSCSQIITVVDSQGPVFEPLSDITVQCVENVEASGATAVDACSGPADVEFWGSQTGEPQTDCLLSTAFGPGADWAVWLPVLSSNNVTSSANFVFDSNGGHFVQFIDGTAHLYGTVVNTANPAEQFIVDLWFENKADWATWSGMGRNYKNDLSLACATADHINWSYYELVGGFSTLTGAGDLAGDVLYIYHMPSSYYFGFQVGIGANNKNCNNGLSGWFTYEGFVDGESVEGHGDVNTDADCGDVNDNDCINNTAFTHFYRAVDACGHATIEDQVITVLDTTAPTFDNCPSSVVIECSDAIPAVAEGITATDNCIGDVVVAYLGETTSGDVCETILTRVWSATDLCGNRADCVQTITIRDTTAPVLSGTPAGEITVECSAVPVAADVTVTDNCDLNVTVSLEEIIDEGNCPGNYTLVRHWFAADTCGNDVDFYQTIHVQDTTAPTFDPYDFYAHIECDEIPAVITATDNCGTATVVVIEEVLNSGGCLGVYYRKYRATDECGNFADAEQYISILDTTAPVLVGIPAEASLECNEVNIGENGNYFDNGGVYGTDNCGMDVVVTYSEEVVETDDNCPQSYDIIRTWVATDYCDNVSTGSQTIHVQDTTAPSLYIPYDYTASCDQELWYDEAYAYDNCGMVTISTVVDTIEGNCPNNYTITRTFVASDECGNSSEPQTQTITVIDETIPTFDYNAEYSFTYECDETIELIQPVATDNCSDVLEYAYTDTFAWGNSCYSGFTRIWSATDECGNVGYFQQYIYVQDTTAPVIAGALELDRPCDDYAGIFVTATDNCNSLEISSWDEHVSGSCAGNVIRHYTATDSCGNASAEFLQIIHLIDTVAPSIDEQTANFEVECGNPYTVGTPVFSDNCDDELEVTPGFSTVTVDCVVTETYTWTAVDHCNNTTVATTIVTIVDTQDPWFENFPPDQTVSCEEELPAVVYPIALDACDESVDLNMTTEETPGECAQERFIYRIFRGYDDCGNSVVQTQTIHVIDETAPMFSYDQNYYFMYECDETIEVIQPLATDNCSEIIEYSYEDTMHYGNSCYSGFTRVWTATDECGNSNFFYQSITVVDETAPVISGALEIDRPCDDYEGIFVTVTDNCNETFITSWDEHVSGSCAGNVIRHYTAYDLCQNTSDEFLQVIHLIDEVDPIVVTSTPDFTVECGQAFLVVPPTFSDNCDEELEVTENPTTSAQVGCNIVWTYSWTAVDHCNNSVTASTNVTVEDTTDPYFTSLPGNYSYDCAEEFVLEGATAADVCDSSVEVTVTTDTIEGNCPASYSIVRVFTATDDCGNSVSETRTIEVSDVTAPSFDYDNSSLYLTYECDEVIPVVEPIAYDNCSTFELSYTDTLEWNQGCYNGFYRMWTATDACGNSNMVYQSINVQDTQAPVVNPFDIEIDMPCDQIVDAVLISAVDNCHEVVIDFSDEYVSGDCAGKIVRTYTVSDICGNYTDGLFQQIITLIDTVAPQITNAPDNIEIECGNPIPAYIPVWSDNCDQDLIVSAISSIGIDGCNQVISEVYFVADHCGNENNVTRIITIVDHTAPVLSNLPEEESYNCGDVIPVAEVTAYDVCDGSLMVNHSDSIVAGNCPANYTIVRTFIAADGCGNEATFEQLINVTDEYAPVFGDNNSTAFTYECGSEVPVIQPVATDNCSTITYSHTDGPVWVDGCLSGFVRSWTAEDACGNESLPFSQYISFEDTTDPVLSGCPTDLVIACDAEIPAPAEVTATDACNGDLIVQYEEFPLGDAPAEGSIADCDLITPVRPANNPCVYPYDWAMALFAMPNAHKWYYVSEGNLVQYPNGSIHLTATMNNVLAPANGWLVDVWFDGAMDWGQWSSQSFPTSFKADCGGEGANHEMWTYLILQAGAGAEMTGFGAYTGSTLNLVHAPANQYFGFQLGDGANNYNGADNGFGGWFSYTGTFMNNSVSGAGDFAMELDCCPDYWIVRQWTATDCSGNSVTCSQTITFEGSTPLIQAPVQSTASNNETKAVNTVAVAPNPANERTMFTFTANNNAKTTLEVFDMTGKKVADVFVGVVEAGIEYRVDYNVNALATGIYTFRLTNGADTQMGRLIINK